MHLSIKMQTEPKYEKLEQQKRVYHIATIFVDAYIPLLYNMICLFEGFICPCFFSLFAKDASTCGARLCKQSVQTGPYGRIHGPLLIKHP